ncbi:peptidylprolyl isomerase [Devosia rhodophyticola]|uniref:Parvulin-like PPIase n=1 Tax=Devosia rhodophyticola TaxID=3026423 RepID=A0ABY7YTJ9_9HYPH|nr:peptidylprolyl isomerase [Devosia rhodophyticola]WDR04698.1 peptidylprolyl isomerase [Devosia rhodophyticola]
MFDRSKRLAQAVSVLALTMGGFAAVPMAMAQDAPAADAAAPAQPDPNAVVATVDGQTITQADVDFAARDLSQDMAQMPVDQRQAYVLSVLIDMKLSAGAARAEKLDQTDVFKQRLAYLDEQALRSAYYIEKLATMVTPDTVKAKYDEFAAQFVPQDEVRASHILVKTEDEAKAVEKELADGADFAEVAKAKSIDPGAANGGDLGFFGKGQMVPEFEKAAFALGEVGSVSEPVKSQFGWHVIKLTEKRTSPVPSMDQVGQKLQQEVVNAAFVKISNELHDKASIEIADKDLAAKIDAQMNPEAAAAAPAN